MSEYVIEMLHITKEFPGIKANDDITLQLRQSEVHALLGENGAGKSTLMSVLFGLYQPESGTIKKNGEVVQINNPNDANDLHIGMVHQHFKLVEVFPVLDNIILGVEPNKAGFLQTNEARQKVLALSEKYGLRVDPDALIEDISVGMQQRVEILKMLYRDNEILIFDEPTAVLTPQEIDELMQIMRNFKEEGKSILFITHKLNEIMAVADRCTVLRKGKCIGTVDIADTSKEELSRMMVGRDISFSVEKKPITPGEVVLNVENVTVPSKVHKKNAVKNVSFNVREGEIVGFSGLVGAGRTEVARSIFGADPLTSGSMTLDGKPFCVNDCARAIKEKVGYMTEDRKTLGLFLDFDITQNFAANRLGGYVKHGMMCDGDLCFVSEQIVKDFRVVTSSIEKKVRELSGGNQQKVLLASWMSIDPKILFVDEPTRGVDVGAKWEIYQLLRNLAKEKRCGIVVISSDLPEILGLSDRIVVMKEGRVAGILDGSTATEKSVMKLAIGSGGEEDGNG